MKHVLKIYGKKGLEYDGPCLGIAAKNVGRFLRDEAAMKLSPADKLKLEAYYKECEKWEW